MCETRGRRHYDGVTEYIVIFLLSEHFFYPTIKSVCLVHDVFKLFGIGSIMQERDGGCSGLSGGNVTQISLIKGSLQKGRCDKSHTFLEGFSKKSLTLHITHLVTIMNYFLRSGWLLVAKQKIMAGFLIQEHKSSIVKLRVKRETRRKLDPEIGFVMG